MKIAMIVLAVFFVVASLVQRNVVLSVWAAVLAVFFIIVWATLHLAQAFAKVGLPAKAP